MSFHYYTPLSFPSRTPSAIFCLFACILEKYVLLVCVRAFLMYEMGIDFTCPFPICAITRFLGSTHASLHSTLNYCKKCFIILFFHFLRQKAYILFVCL